MSNDVEPAAVRLPPSAGLKDLTPAPVLQDGNERAETLRRLLEKGHSAVAPLREPKLMFHSHLPHLLGSAYFLGAGVEQLEGLYEHEVQNLAPIDDTFVRGAITRENWREFLGQKPYTVAYVDFFDQEVRRSNGDWKEVLREYLFPGPEPLINGFTGGLGHPFIHLAYAWELKSPTVASEALSLGCTESEMHDLLDQYPSDNSTYKSTSLADVIKRVHDDSRFDDLFTDPGITNMGILLQNRNRFEALLEHWNAWQVTDPLQQLEQCCDVSILLGIGTGDRESKFDFFLVHTMTVAHGLRILWHFFPEEQRACILRQYALFVLMLYLCQLRPAFDVDMVDSIQTVELGDAYDWEAVVDQALNHRWFMDSHFFKVVRAPKALEETYGRKNGFYLKASAKFVAEFDGWEGFGLGIEGFLPSRDGYRPE